MLGFPRRVNEKAARVVAGGVCLLAIVALLTSWDALVVLIAIGFVLRVLAGPRLSPLGLLATKVVAPRLGEPKEVSGPPKRFAQAMGAVMSGAAAVLALAGLENAAAVLLGALVVAAGLEAVFALCLGCKVFGLLMRTGVVPDHVCAECADIWTRPGFARS